MPSLNFPDRVGGGANGVALSDPYTLLVQLLTDPVLDEARARGG